jgi:hypothetical protein
VAGAAEQTVAAQDPAGGPNLAPAPACDRDSFGLDERFRRSGRWSARASGAGNPHCFGKWGQVVPVTGGRHHRVAVVFRHEGLEAVNVNLLAALVWRLPGRANRACPSDHLSRFRALPGGWTLAEGVFPSPAGCTALDLELYLRFAPRGTVWWDSVAVQEVPAPPRAVTLAAVRWRPQAEGTQAQDLAELSELLDRAGR